MKGGTGAFKLVLDIEKCKQAMEVPQAGHAKERFDYVLKLSPITYRILTVKCC